MLLLPAPLSAACGEAPARTITGDLTRAVPVNETGRSTAARGVTDYHVRCSLNLDTGISASDTTAVEGSP